MKGSACRFVLSRSWKPNERISDTTGTEDGTITGSVSGGITVFSVSVTVCTFKNGRTTRLLSLWLLYQAEKF
jgi:hypothetical protein